MPVYTSYGFMKGNLLAVCHNYVMGLTGHLASERIPSSHGHYYKDPLCPPWLEKYS